MWLPVSSSRVSAREASGHDGHVLDGLHLQGAQGHLALEVSAFVAQEIGRGLERQVGLHRASTMGGLMGLVM